MSLIKWSPNIFEPFEEMDTMFNSLAPQVARSFAPAIDMYEDKNNVIVETQLAGVDPEQVDISIENDVLTIQGKSEKKTEVEEQDYYKKEIRRGSFYRCVQLPTHVISDKAKAEAIDGVLKITVPKALEGKKKKTIKIDIKKK
ncbi:Hsp20/alpha crystallin family protein [Patescibacteria group bacterium]|nr:Hsp20/alpha crystallin family protein [Patescibacteria group bacterium]